MNIKFSSLMNAASIPAIPPKTFGVYIIGVKIDVEGQRNKFCPLYVGEAGRNKKTGIKERLKNNYLHGCKELFDFENHPISDVYQDIYEWNDNHWNFYIPRRRVTCTDKHRLYSAINSSNNTMIYFNCKSFFDSYLKTPGISSYKDNSGHDAAMVDLRSISTVPGDPEDNLSNNIDAVKHSLKVNFCFVYSDAINWPASLKAEAYTKCALEQLRIFTYSKCNKTIYNGYRTKPVGSAGISIDLSNIQAELVNLTGSRFTTPLVKRL